MVNTDLTVRNKANLLEGVSIAFCGGGGIAAIEMPRMARELRRLGASVRFVVTENCLRFVGEESLEWASTQPVTVIPTGSAEHIAVDDAVIVFPATADLIAKMSLGICDSGPTTLVQSALGKKKTVLIFPTMHESLFNSPLVKENRSKLANVEGVKVLSGRLEEGKEKAHTPENFALEVAHYIRGRAFELSGKKKPHAVVTLGGTRAHIDPVRCITNISTGALGKKLCEELYGRGVKVTALQGNSEVQMEDLSELKILKTHTYMEMKNSLEKFSEKSVDAIFHVAAVSDYLPKSEAKEKISSQKSKMTLELVQAQKLLAQNSVKRIPYKVACKLTTGNAAEGLLVARSFLKDSKFDVVVWNSAESAFQKSHDARILTHNTEKEVFGKQMIAEELAKLFIESTSKAASTRGRKS